jgi:Icc-related predicted phosphoesterase
MQKTKIKLLLKLSLLLIFQAFQGYECFLNAQTLKFAFLTDLHVAPGLDNEEALHSVVADINDKNFDFVVVTGDLTNTGSNAELISVKNALDKLNKPLLIIPGNHETNWSESAGLLFNQLWGNDRFLHRINGYLLVGFNTGPFMKMGDGHVKQEDIQWLTNVLNQNKGEKVISFSHYPIADGLDNWTDVSKLLNENDCMLAFCGHGHNLRLMNFDNMPGIMGRALKDNKGFGYNAVELNTNQVKVIEILLNNEKQPKELVFDFGDPKLSELAVSPNPDYSVNSTSPVKIQFEFRDTVSIFTGPCLWGDSLLIYGNSCGWVKAVRIKSKTIAWQQQFNGAIYSTPVVTSGVVVFGTADGAVKGLNLRDGSEIWSVKVGRPVLAEAVVEKHFVYMGGGDKAFYKIDARTGNVIWSFNGIDGPIQGITAISGKYVVFGAWDTHLYCLDKNTGTIIWKWNNGKNNHCFLRET